MNDTKPNKLIAEKSPYLLQHAYNPVDWLPWDEEAFAKAKAENKPIFLSIGYSTCHWCHVMEHESFEDQEVADVLNRDFISIKVDREERPDIDHLYMSVCQAMTGQGGWPLTIVMTPDQKPFFAGTYFPKQRKYNRYGLLDILPQITEKWTNDAEKLLQSAETIATRTQEKSLANMKGAAPQDILEQAFNAYKDNYRPDYGGFGGAPKFPTSHNLSFLLRHYHATGEQKALEMVEHTLHSMFRGGMFDHVGKGFARYSTDEQWLIPHFEKMLYDNALLAMTYLEAFQITQNHIYLNVAEDIFTYVLRDMTDIQGGFYSAEDADSEGVEGKFYGWTPDEVKAVLGNEEGKTWCDVYGITIDGNFEGASIPNLLDCNLKEYLALNQASTSKLYMNRETRIKPGKDDKILTSWNGLMIMAFAKGAKVTGNSNYVEAASRAFDFVWSKMRREDGRLLARYRDGEVAIPAFLDDYAFMLWAAIELAETTGDEHYIDVAKMLADSMLDLFEDTENGGFYFSGSDAEQLLTRTKEIYDGAIPSGNFVGATNLIRLARLTGVARYEVAAKRTLDAYGGAIERYPMGYSMYLTAYQLLNQPPVEIKVEGNLHLDSTKEMIRIVHEEFIPSASIQLIAKDVEPSVMICYNFACQPPIYDIEQLKRSMMQLANISTSV
jgi:uncharacterized protein YyaL (SSP411 family)